MTRTVATLPPALRAELREPLGPVFTDAERLLAGVDGPVVAVGDVVTHHLVAAGRRPDVAVVDGRTERETVDSTVAATVDRLGVDRRVENEPATLSADLVRALADAIAADEPVVVEVDGEEDLAALPAVLLAPDGAAVVYGQPGEGMVRTLVDADARATVRGLLERFDTEPELWELLDRR